MKISDKSSTAVSGLLMHTFAELFISFWTGRQFTLNYLVLRTKNSNFTQEEPNCFAINIRRAFDYALWFWMLNFWNNFFYRIKSLKENQIFNPKILYTINQADKKGKHCYSEEIPNY